MGNSIRGENGETIGQYLHRMRTEKHLSFRALAAAVGNNHAYLRRIEEGLHKQPSPETLRRLSEVLDADYADMCAIVGYVIPKDLPTLPTYLRSKYHTTPDETRQITDLFQQLRQRMPDTIENEPHENVTHDE